MWLSDRAHIHTNKRMKERKEGRKKGREVFPSCPCGVWGHSGAPPALCWESFRRLPNTVPPSLLLLSWNALPSRICLAAWQTYCPTIRSLLPHTHSSLWFSRINLASCLTLSLCLKAVFLLDTSHGILVPGYLSIFLVALTALLGGWDAVPSLCEYPAAWQTAGARWVLTRRTT